MFILSRKKNIQIQIANFLASILLNWILFAKISIDEILDAIKRIIAIVCNEIFTKYCSKERIYYLLFSQFILILNLTNYYCRLHFLKSKYDITMQSSIYENFLSRFDVWITDIKRTCLIGHCKLRNAKECRWKQPPWWKLTVFSLIKPVSIRLPIYYRCKKWFAIVTAGNNERN